MSGSDGLRSRARTIRPGFVVVGWPPARRVVGASGRAPYLRRPPGRLTDEERRAIRAGAASRSLRDLAAEFDVSHETVRAVLREPDGDAAGKAA